MAKMVEIEEEELKRLQNIEALAKKVGHWSKDGPGFGLESAGFQSDLQEMRIALGLNKFGGYQKPSKVS